VTDPRRTLLLFEQAVALDIADRERFLADECRGDSALRAEIDALIRADSDAGDFLDQPISEPGNRIGERLGAYRLVALLGSGGMGTVYKAERADGAFAKPVAIKLLLFDAGDLRTRFALEQRILGALSHPNIASLLDVGQDANGAPYLVMEFVEGQPITRYAHDLQLSLNARIELFRKILDAVQMAHAQLVVHRDIKPGNVLVDTHDEPKLLDFGIAKLLDGSVSAATRTGLGPLTPEYASPEQVRGEPIGTGSDIYSLGVLLYELVTGERPYRIDDTRPAAIEHTICETDPPRPSSRLTLRGEGSRRDLDAVIRKAMEKRAADRYASCAAFADDLRRWLDGVQVLAREPALGERAARFVRRHRLGVSVAAAASLALMAGSIVALWQAHMAREQAQIARSERDRAERINHFLGSMLAAADPGDLGRKATVADVLDRAQVQAERELTDDPITAAQTELTLARTYAALGNFDAARHCAELALAAAKRANDPAVSIESQLAFGTVLKVRGEYDAAKPILESARRDAIDHGTALQKGDAAQALGSLENGRGDYAQAEKWFDIALAELPADAVSSRAETLNDLAIVKSIRGDDAAALKLHVQTVDMLRKLYPGGHPQLAEALGNLANSLEANGKIDDAKKVFAETLTMQTDLLGVNHPSVVSVLSSMTNLDIETHDIPAAVEHGARAWSAAQHVSSENPVAAYAAVMYGDALLQSGRAQEARTLLETALTMRKAVYPADHPLIANTESVLALTQALAGDIAGGERLARSAYERQRDKLGEKNALTVIAKQRLDEIEALKTPR
jgi:serine/threonine-protein kinase